MHLFIWPLLAYLIAVFIIGVGIEKLWWQMPSLEVKNFLLGAGLAWTMAFTCVALYAELKTQKKRGKR